VTSPASTTSSQVNLDFDRSKRIGFGEAVLSDCKSTAQLVEILDRIEAARTSMLLTRLSPEQVAALPSRVQERVDYDETSRTAYFGAASPMREQVEIAVVTGGTSDATVAGEALRTLEFNGFPALAIHDVGVAGLWRLQQRIDEIASARIVIAIAGMDGALPTVLGGLVSGAIIAVPVSTGYGIADGGRTALHSLLASCAPGLTVVNIDNGYGAACAAMRILGSARGSHRS